MTSPATLLLCICCCAFAAAEPFAKLRELVNAGRTSSAAVDEVFASFFQNISPLSQSSSSSAAAPCTPAVVQASKMPGSKGINVVTACVTNGQSSELVKAKLSPPKTAPIGRRRAANAALSAAFASLKSLSSSSSSSMRDSSYADYDDDDYGFGGFASTSSRIVPQQVSTCTNKGTVLILAPVLPAWEGSAFADEIRQIADAFRKASYTVTFKCNAATSYCSGGIALSDYVGWSKYAAVVLFAAGDSDDQGSEQFVMSGVAPSDADAPFTADWQAGRITLSADM
jgi:hypothetical protein